MRVFKCPEGLETLGKHNVAMFQSFAGEIIFAKNLVARCFLDWSQMFKH